MKATGSQFELIKNVSRHVVPLVIKTNDIFKLRGSAVYLKRNDVYLLITASHVVPPEIFDKIYVPFKQNFFRTIPCSGTLTIGHEEVDLCIFILDEILAEYNAIDYSLLENLHETGSDVLLTGFPASRTKTYDRKIIFEQRFIISQTIENKGYFKVYNKGANTVCDFHQSKIFNGLGNLIKHPNLWGMSGGAMFSTRFNNESDSYSYKLAGIMTEWNDSLRQFVKCTNISIACDAINNHFGENTTEDT